MDVLLADIEDDTLYPSIQAVVSRAWRLQEMLDKRLARFIVNAVAESFK